MSWPCGQLFKVLLLFRLALAMHLGSAGKKMALVPENVPKDTVYAVFVSPFPLLLSSSISMYPESHELFSPTFLSQKNTQYFVKLRIVIGC